MGRYNWEDELEIFLGGTFHQDIESPEDALEEYLKEDKDHIEHIVKIITDFLNSGLSEEEKNKFIEVNTEIYFKVMGVKPIIWVENVKNYLFVEINRK